MIEMTFQEFHEGKYEELGYCLYVIKNGLGDVLYVGMTTGTVWSRWFSARGHVFWDGRHFSGESAVGRKIEYHLPDSLQWLIQLGQLQEALEFCDIQPPDFEAPMSVLRYDSWLRRAEEELIRKLSPVLNIMLNQNPGIDHMPQSEREMQEEAELDRVYREIFERRNG